MFDKLAGNELDFGITLAAAILAILGMIWSRIQSTKPVQVGKIRWLNYNILMMFCFFILLVSLAHLYSLITGSQLEPRRRRGM